MKKCIYCKRELSLDNFYLSSAGYRSSGCKDCLKKRGKERLKNNPEIVRAYRRKWRAKYKMTFSYRSQVILDNMRKRSRKKGFGEPEFTVDDVKQAITGGRCAITGIKFEFDHSKYSKSPWTPVPDRIDSSKGYTKDNVQWVCHMFNSMKQEYSMNDVKFFIDKLKEGDS